MARGLEDLKAQGPQLDDVAVRQGAEFEVRPGARAEVDARADALAQLQVPGQEVGVKVGQDHVPDREAQLCRFLQVEIHVAPGVDDHGGLRLLVADQVGGLGETGQVVLLEDHGAHRAR